MDSVDDAIRLLSGLYCIRIKRKTSFYNLDTEFWFDPSHFEKSVEELVSFVKAELNKNHPEFEYDVRTHKDHPIIASNELHITVYKRKKIEYGERIVLQYHLTKEN